MQNIFRSYDEANALAIELSKHLDIPATRIRTALAKAHNMPHIDAFKKSFSSQRIDAVDTGGQQPKEPPSAPETHPLIRAGHSVTVVISAGSVDVRCPLLTPLYDSMRNGPSFDGEAYVTSMSNSDETRRLELIESIAENLDSLGIDDGSDTLNTILAAPRIGSSTTLYDLGILFDPIDEHCG